MSPSSYLDNTAVQRRFERAAAQFDNADFVHARTRDGLFDRLLPLLVDAERVVDLGCATGASVRRLQQRFRGAKLFCVDQSAAMLERAGKRGSFLDRLRFGQPELLQADALNLPFADHSIDVVFANLLLPWMDKPRDLAHEITRVLRKDGLFIFSSLGPDSLRQLRDTWAAVDDDDHVMTFPDMHDVGDALVAAGLRDPVLDVEHLTVQYRRLENLFADLSAVGGRNSMSSRRKSLTGPGRISALRASLQRANTVDRHTTAGKTDRHKEPPIDIGLELVFGHCWGGGTQPGAEAVHIDPRSIPLRRR